MIKFFIGRSVKLVFIMLAQITFYQFIQVSWSSRHRTRTLHKRGHNWLNIGGVKQGVVLCPLFFILLLNASDAH